MPTKNVYEILGTRFGMQIRMPTQNMYKIQGIRIGHWIQYGDKNAHQEYMKYQALDLGTGFSMEI